MALALKVETTCRETVSSCTIFQNRLWVLGEREGPVDIHERAPRWLEVPWVLSGALGCADVLMTRSNGRVGANDC